VLAPSPPIPPGRCRLQGPGGTLVAIAEVVLQAPAEPRLFIRPQIVFVR